MAQFVVAIIGGLGLGGIYTLMALGVVMAFRATGTFNFAQGEFMLFPAFLVGYWQANNSIPTPLAIALALLIMAVIAAIFYRVVLQRITGKQHLMGVIATLGLATMLDGVILLIFGSPEYQIKLSVLPQGVVDIAGARFSQGSLWLTGFALVLALTVAGVLRFTQLGRWVRVAGQDAMLAGQGGVNVRRMHMGSWALAAILAGVAGITYGALNLVSGSSTDVALAAFPAILLGGMDSIGGAIVGGLFIGIFQQVVASYLGGKYIDVLTYSLLVVVMIFLPEGLFGTRQIRRV